MHISRPELLQIVVLIVAEAQSGHVIEQGIDPDIDHVTGIKVHRYAPSKAGTADTQVLQTGLNEVIDHLIDTAVGLQEVSVFQ